MGDRHLTPQQEQFLRELFELCDRYQGASLFCSSQGTTIERDGSVMIIHVELRLDDDSDLYNEGSDRQ